MKLTRDNYHSKEANQRYMSWHQFLNFLECEAGALSSLRLGTHEETDALIMGTLLHAWNEGEEAFKESFEKYRDRIHNRTGGLYAAYKPLYEMIDTLEGSDLCMKALEGEKEVIMNGFFAGVEWKNCIDSFNREAYRISDLKSAANLKDRMYSPFSGKREGFISARGYVGQVSIYSEIIRQNMCEDYYPEPHLVMVTKEKPPDKEIISFDSESIEWYLDFISEKMPRVLEVKSGAVEPTWCGKCAYCRLQKVLTGTVHYSDVGG